MAADHTSPLSGFRTDTERRLVSAAMALPALLLEAKGHGHAGTAMALAPTAHVLFHRVMRHDPAHPEWEGRDRFILSAGHASLLLYIQLHLTGYGLSLDDLAAGRTLGALTPGHPERGHTAGVEMSTGPLGQGVASAVGLALAARRDAARFDAGADLWDPTVFALAGDGCLQEGVSGEASSLAGTLGLDNLVLIWDDNRITIDGGTEVAFAEDVRARYAAYGWRVIDADDFLDLDALERALTTARQRDGRPTLVAVRSTIGFPAPTASGTPGAHSGALGADEVRAVLTTLGFSPDATAADLVDDDTRAAAFGVLERGAEARRQWSKRELTWRAEHPDLAAERDRLRDPDRLAADAERAIRAVPLPDPGAPVATRKTNGAMLAALHAEGILWGGSADLAGSTTVTVPGEVVSASHPDGASIAFGIREHAMAAILSGIALHGLWRPYGSTYLAFSDYQRPALRLAALMALPVVQVYTHDSIAVGEDGPTHQPVEQIAALRTIPGLDVVRPGDAAEVAAAWQRLARPERPAALVLSRQDIPALADDGAVAEGVARGGYVRTRVGSGDDLALIATGSELHLAVAAAERLGAEGIGVRVVSMPCVEWFDAQPAAWRDAVLPPTLRARVAVEAGRTDAWHRFTGLDGAVVGVDNFGESGSGAELMALRGITTDAVVAAARTVLAR